jgi:ankyrin repeat protein
MALWQIQHQHALRAVKGLYQWRLQTILCSFMYQMLSNAMPGAQRIYGLQGVTPLHIAATMGHETIAILLIRFRALVSFPITSACKVSAVWSCLPECLSVCPHWCFVCLPACLPASCWRCQLCFLLASCWQSQSSLQGSLAPSAFNLTSCFTNVQQRVVKRMSSKNHLQHIQT